jgi:hypothetical protein
MTRVWIDEDELWPDYTVTTKEPGHNYGHNPIDVPAETLARWDVALEAYRQRSDEIAEAVESSCDCKNCKYRSR